jgi:hypothetical protein
VVVLRIALEVERRWNAFLRTGRREPNHRVTRYHLNYAHD